MSYYLTSKHRKPPEHSFYGDNYERGKEPFAELKGNVPTDGWFLLDAWGNQIAFCEDGTAFHENSTAKLYQTLEIIGEDKS